MIAQLFETRVNLRSTIVPAPRDAFTSKLRIDREQDATTELFSGWLVYILLVCCGEGEGVAIEGEIERYVVSVQNGKKMEGES